MISRNDALPGFKYCLIIFFSSKKPALLVFPLTLKGNEETDSSFSEFILHTFDSCLLQIMG